MKIISQKDKDVIHQSLEILQGGGIIVYPTDTLYGFGAEATNNNAIDKINNIKGRSGPMSVMAADKNMALDWMNITSNEIKIIEPYLGGAKTLIVSVKFGIASKIILGENNTLGIRIPHNYFCNELSMQFGKPITSTSVNRTGEQPMNDPKMIVSEFGDEIDLMIDAGTLTNSKGSTIYQYKDNKIKILRD